MEDTYTMTLADGTELTNLYLNGNNFISLVPIKEGTFTEESLKDVAVINTKTGELIRFRDAFLVQLAKYGDEYWFILAEKTKEEKEWEELASKSDRTMAVQEYNIMMGNLEDPLEDVEE